LHLTRLPIRVHDGAVEPVFLGDSDGVWLEALLVTAAQHVGATWGALEAAMRRPVCEGVPVQRQAVAAYVLARMYQRRVEAALPPADVRAMVFGLAAGKGERAAIIARAAEELEIDAAAVEQALFADLPAERIVVAPPRPLTAAELAVRSNLEMCRSLLMRAMDVEIQVTGRAHSLVRRAQRGGLLWSLLATDGDAGCLRLSGPLRLFRRTTRYGHALGSLLPALADCDRFDLTATILLGEREVELRLRSGDPFLPAVTAERRKPSMRFARLVDQGEWIVRDAQPIPVGRRVLFPDVEMLSRQDAALRWLIERVGFWTGEYLEEVAAAYRAAGISRLILCVDERLRCGAGDAREGVRVLRHRGRITREELCRVLTQ
jgi:predicted nuclease of restriction endonuclease-like RecB superfamily